VGLRRHDLFQTGDPNVLIVLSDQFLLVSSFTEGICQRRTTSPTYTKQIGSHRRLC
jgi:hypothetical protein